MSSIRAAPEYQWRMLSLLATVHSPFLLFSLLSLFSPPALLFLLAGSSQHDCLTIRIRLIQAFIVTSSKRHPHISSKASFWNARSSELAAAVMLQYNSFCDVATKKTRGKRPSFRVATLLCTKGSTLRQKPTYTTTRLFDVLRINMT